MTAAAVKLVQASAARKTAANANVRLPSRTKGPRSMNGTRNNVSTATPGRTTAPKTSSGPLKNLMV